MVSMENREKGKQDKRKSTYPNSRSLGYCKTHRKNLCGLCVLLWFNKLFRFLPRRPYVYQFNLVVSRPIPVGYDCKLIY